MLTQVSNGYVWSCLSVASTADTFHQCISASQERLLRTGEFCLKGMSSVSGEDAVSGKHELSTIESLLGDRGSQRVLLGMITQPDEGVWHIEDLTSSMQIDLSSDTLSKTGLITEGCIVVVEGFLRDGIFRVEVWLYCRFSPRLYLMNCSCLWLQFMGLPPGEERYDTLNAIGAPPLTHNTL